jgi:hypothetical protein
MGTGEAFNKHLRPRGGVLISSEGKGSRPGTRRRKTATNNKTQ